VFKELPRNETIGKTILEVKNLTTAKVHGISFRVAKGEILGFSGLVGSGRTEIMLALFGLDTIIDGEILLDGKSIKPQSPAQAIDLGLAMVPEDRKIQGILPNISVKGNISISVLKRFLNWLGMVDTQSEEKIALKAIEKFNIKTPDAEKLISQLSGGNQQKTILARWLETNPKVLILDEPTKGIDVGAKSEFYRIICECAKLGMAVIVISSELPEIIGLCDRVIVIREGTISGEVLRASATEENILKYAMIDQQNVEG
jgi:L-arabinose transport system ATP-binding protein